MPSTNWKKRRKLNELFMWPAPAIAVVVGLALLITNTHTRTRTRGLPVPQVVVPINKTQQHGNECEPEVEEQ